MNGEMVFVFLVVTAAIGGFIQSSTGFGFALFTMALWPLVVPVVDATIMEMFAVLASIIYLVIKLRKHINYKILWVPALVATALSLGGFAMQHMLPERMIRQVLGVVLVLLSIWFFFFNHRIKLKANWKQAIAASAIAGTMGGLCNISGPPMVLYYSAACKSKEEYNATIQAFFLIGVSAKLIFSMVNGMATQTLRMVPILFAASVIGTFFGYLVFQKLPIDKIKKTVYGMMICAGIYYVFA